MKIFRISACLLMFSIFSVIINSCTTREEQLPIVEKNSEVIENQFASRMGNQLDERGYAQMMQNLRNDIDNILSETKPEELSLYDYKVKLVNGDIELPSNSQERINASSQNLISYARNLAIVNNIGIDVNDDSELIGLGGMFSPGDDLTVTFPGDNIMQVSGNALTWGEVAECVAVGVGADAIWALGTSGATAWTAAALTKAFTAVAKRFLGPIGVAIAVVSFGVCIASQAND